jgi:hypothetical protein
MAWASRAEDLERVMSDASSSADVRIGAAVALRVADAEAGDRIRIASSQTAAPELRSALKTSPRELPTTISNVVSHNGRLERDRDPKSLAFARNPLLGLTIGSISWAVAGLFIA